MTPLQTLLSGFPLFITPMSIAMCTVGVFLGLVIGVLPGLGPLMGIVLLTPIAVKLPPVAGLGLLIAVYIGGSCGGAVSAILLRIPGTPMAAATMLDGYPMAQQGRAGQAIGMSVAASTLGGLIGGLFLIFLTPYLAAFALKFGPPEYFALGITGLISIAVISRQSTIKGMMMGIVGLLTATIGADSFTGIYRFTFGSERLLGGVNIVAIVVGLFALPEMFKQIHEGGLDIQPKMQAVKVSLYATIETLKRWGTLVRSSLIGVVIGALPGTGGVVAAFAAYAVEKESSDDPESFGTGRPEGVIASQAADNACAGGTLIPTLALGIPGDATSAVFMGALYLLGFFPGARMFEKNLDVVGGIFASYMFSNVLMLFMGILCTPLFVSFLKLKKQYLIPIVIMLSVVGTFALQSSIYDLWIMLFFGVAGFMFEKYAYPLSPLVIGAVLGSIIEDNFRRSLVISGEHYSIFVSRPLAAAILLLNGLMLAWIAVPRATRRRLRPAQLLVWRR